MAINIYYYMCIDVEKKTINKYKIKKSNPIYYCTTESWKKEQPCMRVKIEKSMMYVCKHRKINKIYFSKEIEP